MRRASITAFSLLLVATLATAAWAGKPTQRSSRQKSDCDKGCASKGGECRGCGRGGRCGGCGAHGVGLHGRCAKTFEGQDPWFSCGCNGSYKYPVPPQSTYWWPGMYSAQLMTDYHSPWRFPPIKPYTDENVEPEARRLQPIQPISHSPRTPSLKTSLAPKRYSVAEKMRQFYNR